MNLYLTLKALHLIAAISWMAGLLYLPRIFVYHTETVKDDQQNLTFKTMERKLYNYIMMPAMIFTWLFGILLIHSLGFSVFLELWFQLKGLMILVLTHYHFYLGKCIRLFSINQNTKTSKFYRIINEVPTILLIIIIFAVIFKPL
ncbi:MAG: protoporphyrinogen oxidase HemJ [Pelagibacteraceae bacterium]|tara:strand:- start:268 stop:702 length:435 start_codon:yes stop_codon:yes gene_type:complete